MGEILQKVLDGRMPYTVKPPQGGPVDRLGGALPERTGGKEEEESEDDDWCVADDYESEDEQEVRVPDLFEVMGVEPKMVGSRSKASTRKMDKKIKRDQEEARREDDDPTKKTSQPIGKQDIDMYAAAR